MKLYQKIAKVQQAYENCVKSGNLEWEQKHLDTLMILQDLLPSGSGFDCGTKIGGINDEYIFKPDRIILKTDYHMMDEYGYYCGWIENIKIIVTPDWHGVHLNIIGQFKKDKTQALKDYMYELFYDILQSEIDENYNIILEKQNNE